MKLHLGVIVAPYADKQNTGDVAEILEENYGVMGYFFEKHSDDVAKDLEKSLAGAMDTILAGGPVNDPFAGARSKVEERFRDFLDNEEMAGQPGVPTQAALKRRSLRFKGKKGKNKRPSFVDTGLYEANFKAWIDANG